MPLQDPQKLLSQGVEYPTLSEDSDTRGSIFQDLPRILRRRKWLVIAPLLIILPIVVMLQAAKKPVYEAKISVLLDRATLKILSNKEVLEPTSALDFRRTQIEIVQSDHFLAQVVDTLRLYDQPENPEEDSRLERAINAVTSFSGRILNVVKDWVRLDSDTLFPSDTHNDTHALEQRRQRAIEQLQHALRVEPRNYTQMIDISLRSSNADQAAQQVQMVVETYVKQDLANKLVESKKAIAWLKTKTEDLSEKIHKTELTVQDFRKKNEFVSIGDFELARNIVSETATNIHNTLEGIYSGKKILQRNIDELKNSMVMIKEDNNYNEKAALTFESLSDIPNISFISSLRQKYLESQIRYTTLSKDLGNKHPNILRLKTEIGEIKNLMYEEMQKSLDNMQKKYRMMVEQERVLKNQLSTQKDKALSISNAVIEYSKMKNNIEIDKELYLSLSKQLSELSLTQALETNNIRLLADKPVVKRLPSGRVKNVFVGVMCALGLGIGLALVIDYLDHRVKSVDEVERELGAPFFGLIPQYQANRSRPVTLYEPKSGVAEDYRELRTWVWLSLPTSPQSLMLTSAAPGEGKSLTAANLAIALAQLGKRVVLIDADLRRPALHLSFRIANNAGLTDILARGAQWQPLLQDTVMENLKVLPSGGQPHNPSELLNTNRLKNLLAALKSSFDMIIVDAPVTLSITDVPIMASAMDGVLFIYSPSKSDKAALHECKTILTRAGARIVGVVANNISVQDQRGYYYSSKYQGCKYYAAPSSSRLKRTRVIDVDFVDMRPELPDSPSATDGVCTTSS